MKLQLLTVALVGLVLAGRSDALWVSAPEDENTASVNDLAAGPISCSLKPSAHPTSFDIKNECGASQANQMCKFETEFCKCQQESFGSKANPKKYWSWKCSTHSPGP